MQEGRALLLDDATLISPKVLAALYPAMDGRRQIQVKAHKGETITAADGFYVIAGHNPGFTVRSSPKPSPAGSACRSRWAPTTTSPLP